MNESERIIEVNGYSKLVPITWHEDPTRHLLKQKAVNAKSNGDSETQPSHSVTAVEMQEEQPCQDRLTSSVILKMML